MMRGSMRLFSACILTATCLATSASANSVDQIEAEMRAQGFEIIEKKTTLLGRMKIEAIAPHGEWEVVMTRWGRILKEEREFEDEDGNGIHDDFEEEDDD